MYKNKQREKFHFHFSFNPNVNSIWISHSNQRTTEVLSSYLALPACRTQVMDINLENCNLDEYNVRITATKMVTKKGQDKRSNKCSQCDYASSQAGNLRTHLKTHSGEKPRRWRNKKVSADGAAFNSCGLECQACKLFSRPLFLEVKSVVVSNNQQCQGSKIFIIRRKQGAGLTSPFVHWGGLPLLSIEGGWGHFCVHEEIFLLLGRQIRLLWEGSTQRGAKKAAAHCWRAWKA